MAVEKNTGRVQTNLLRMRSTRVLAVAPARDKKDDIYVQHNGSLGGGRQFPWSHVPVPAARTTRSHVI